MKALYLMPVGIKISLSSSGKQWEPLLEIHKILNDLAHGLLLNR